MGLICGKWEVFIDRRYDQETLLSTVRLSSIVYLLRVEKLPSEAQAPVN